MGAPMRYQPQGRLSIRPEWSARGLAFAWVASNPAVNAAKSANVDVRVGQLVYAASPRGIGASGFSTPLNVNRLIADSRITGFGGTGTFIGGGVSAGDGALLSIGTSGQGCKLGVYAGLASFTYLGVADYTTNLTIPSGPVVIGATIGNNSATVLAKTANGIGSQTLSVGTPVATSQPLRVGTTGSSDQWPGSLEFAFYFTKQLSSAELRTLVNNPWALFDDAYEDDEVAIAAAPSGLTLTPTAASLSLTGYAPSIAQAATLSPSGASLALTGSAPTIIQSSALSPSSATLSLSGYAPQVWQAVTLSPAEASLTMTGYVPSVSQVAPVTLAPQGYAFTLSTDAPTVSQGATVAPMGDGGGAGPVREVRAFADLLNKASKPSRKQKKARREQLEAEALELLPNLPEAEKLAPIAARIVYEQEARAMAPLYAERPIQAMAPVIAPFDAHAALRELIEKLLAEAALQQKVAEDEENDVELLLFGT